MNDAPLPLRRCETHDSKLLPRILRSLFPFSQVNLENLDSHAVNEDKMTKKKKKRVSN